MRLIGPGVPYPFTVVVSHDFNQCLTAYRKLVDGIGPLLKAVFSIEVKVSNIDFSIPSNLPHPYFYEGRVCWMSALSIPHYE